MIRRTFNPPPVESMDLRGLKDFDGHHIIVIGAGAFGGWTALHLQRRGYTVTLIDTWGAGNSRSSSGDETRVIRSAYGTHEGFFDLNVLSLNLWSAHQHYFNKQILYQPGVLWLCYGEHTPLVDAALPYAEKYNTTYEYIGKDRLRQKFPVIHTDDLHHAYLDKTGGYLKARESCQAVRDLFINEGGEFLQQEIVPGKIVGGRMQHILGPQTYEGDLYIFACGAWLPRIFPDVLESVITCTRQEVYYFGTPASSAQLYDSLPVWIDADGTDFYYGIPGNEGRGFKVGVDIRGAPFDPTGTHLLDEAVLQGAKNFLAKRFPGLADAPLIENRVCPYENSPDGNFLLAVHPKAENVLLLGGGSGHGFKHSPAVGYHIANYLKHGTQLPPVFKSFL